MIMAYSQDAADALNDEVKDLVKDLQDRNNHLEKKVESMSAYIVELNQEISDMVNKEYDVWNTWTSNL